ncbi:hypothetical protein LPLAFNJD_LOCUS2335 [Methylorubrum aminovorans]
MTFGRLSRALAVQGGDAAADALALRENGRPTAKGRGYQFNGTSAADADDPDAASDIVAAVDVALELGRPLLVAGEPGCGKTELGYAIARRLGITNVYLHSVKSSSDAAELFYAYDALQRFRDAQLGLTQGASNVSAPPSRDVGDYVEYQALGRAILDAHQRGDVAHLLRGKHAAHRSKGQGPQASVVVIDEIDKAPRDFPNDLLHEIDSLSFRVREFPADPPPETPPGDRIPPETRPIVIVTSNEERQLPDAFLRRCMFHEIAFPKGPALQAIITAGLATRLARMGWTGARAPELDAQRTKALVTFLTEFRARDPDKKPGIAEMLDAAALLFVSERKDLGVVRPAVAKLRRDMKLFDELVRE